MGKVLNVILAVWILIQPGCIYSSGTGVQARKTPQPSDVSLVIYLILAMFCVILIVSIACALLGDAKENPGNTLVSCVTALISTLVILLLVA